MQCGKIFTFSYGADGSPLLFMTPSRNDTEPSPRQVKNTVFVIERAVDLMVDGVRWERVTIDTTLSLTPRCFQRSRHGPRPRRQHQAQLRRARSHAADPELLPDALSLTLVVVCRQTNTLDEQDAHQHHVAFYRVSRLVA